MVPFFYFFFFFCFAISCHQTHRHPSPGHFGECFARCSRIKVIDPGPIDHTENQGRHPANHHSNASPNHRQIGRNDRSVASPNHSVGRRTAAVDAETIGASSAANPGRATTTGPGTEAATAAAGRRASQQVRRIEGVGGDQLRGVGRVDRGQETDHKEASLSTTAAPRPSMDTSIFA